MKVIHWMITALGLIFALPAVADAATTDPEVIIYRFPGVLDDGGGIDAGVATVFHCTNFSGVTENIRFVTRDFAGGLLQNDALSSTHLATKTVVTHQTHAYTSSLNLLTGPIFQGTTAIAATSTNIICTAMTIEASTAAPIGVALRGIRFSPVPGSQE